MEGVVTIQNSTNNETSLEKIDDDGDLPSTVASSSNGTVSSPTTAPTLPAPLVRTASRDRYGFELHQESMELQRSDKQKQKLAETELIRTKKWVKMIKRWDYTLTHKADKLQERIRKGIPDSVRGEVWKKLARVDDMKRLYPQAFSLHSSSAIPELTLDEIERDINRTFPQHDIFQNGQDGQNALRKVLRSYAAFDPEVGYCQGMGFIAAMFLIYMPQEEAFYALLSLMQRPTLPLRAMYRAEMPGTKVVLGVFADLAQKYLPNIWQHLCEQNIHHSMFATSWFMTVYTNSFPFDLVTRIFDVLWYEGWKIVYRVALALLKYSEHDILSNDFEHIMFHFRSLPKSVDYVRLWKIVWEIPLKSDVIEKFTRNYRDDGGARI